MNHALLHELISEQLTEQPCLIHRDKIISWTEITDRTRRLADVFRQHGLGCHTERSQLDNWQVGQDTIGLYLYNGCEYLEAMLAAYKSRTIPFNVNYRYFDDELSYLFQNAQCKAIVYHASFAPMIEKIRSKLPLVRLWIQVEDDSNHPLLPGSLDYEKVITQASPIEPKNLNSDDVYMVYTGGTTGLPKGVIWRQEDIFYSALHKKRHTEMASYVDEIKQQKYTGLRGLPAPPFMHATAHWVAFGLWYIGGCVVIQSNTSRFDPDDFWSTLEKHRVNSAVIVGDAFAVPLIEQLAKKNYHLKDFKRLTSGGAILSDASKKALIDHLPHLNIVDTLGSSEAGAQASRHYSKKNQTIQQFTPADFGVVINDALTAELPQNNHSEGWLARSGFIPLGYLNDKAKTEKTFPEINGSRYSVPGDRAHWQKDGTIKLLGRDSATINTGGEKVFSEEVEMVIKDHPAVYDAIVIGTAHEKFGSQVTALIQIRLEMETTETAIIDSMRDKISSYKLPKLIYFVEKLHRNPNGKPDFKWAHNKAKDQAKKRLKNINYNHVGSN